MPFVDTLKEHNCTALHNIVETSSGKFVCFTRLDGQHLHICASEGYEIWKLDLDEEAVDTYKDVAQLNTEAFLNKLRTSFQDGDLQITQDGVKLTLTIGQGTPNISFDLYEAKAFEKRQELQSILFRLAESSLSLQTKLDKANSTIESLRHNKDGTAGAGGIFDVGDSKKKAQAKVAPKQTGMSVINPGTRKRKAARGVEFD